MAAQHKRPGYTARNERRQAALDRMKRDDPTRDATLKKLNEPPKRSWRGPRRRKARLAA